MEEKEHHLEEGTVEQNGLSRGVAASTRFFLGMQRTQRVNRQLCATCVETQYMHIHMCMYMCRTTADRFLQYFEPIRERHNGVRAWFGAAQTGN